MINSIILKISLLFVLSQSGTAFAGVSSGGAKLFKYEENPWWIMNTGSVSYCIKRDPKHFSVDKRRLSKIVRDVIGEWKAAFAIAGDGPYNDGDRPDPYDNLKIATQTFIERECKDTSNPQEQPGTGVDLTIQFGYLEREQVQFFDDPRNYVGAAVRTSYDLESLSSKGFIYIAPLAGPLRPTSANFDPDAWQVCDNCLLKGILRHEFAHVFGFGHVGKRPLLDKKIGEKLIKKEMVENVRANPNKGRQLDQRLDPIRLFGVTHGYRISGCGEWRPIWHATTVGIPVDHQCNRIVLNKGSLEIYSAARPGDDYVLKGTASWSHQETGYTSGSLIEVIIPPEQKVFSRIPDLTPGVVEGVFGTLQRTIRSVYMPENGHSPTPLQFAVYPEKWDEFKKFTTITSADDGPTFGSFSIYWRYWEREYLPHVSTTR